MTDMDRWLRHTPIRVDTPCGTVAPGPTTGRHCNEVRGFANKARAELRVGRNRLAMTSERSPKNALDLRREIQRTHELITRSEANLTHAMQVIARTQASINEGRMTAEFTRATLAEEWSGHAAERAAGETRRPSRD